MVLGLAASQPTRFSEITGEGNRAKSTLLNAPLTLLFSYFTSLITTSWRTSCVTYSFARPDNSIFGGNNNPKYQKSLVNVHQLTTANRVGLRVTFLSFLFFLPVTETTFNFLTVIPQFQNNEKNISKIKIVKNGLTTSKYKIL